IPARISLAIRTRLQELRELPFVVDSAAALTSIPISTAAELGMIIPRQSIEFTLETATGPARQFRHPGRIQGRIPGLEAWAFDWPCHFVVHRGAAPKAVLGLGGVLNDLRITRDGTYALDAPY